MQYMQRGQMRLARNGAIRYSSGHASPAFASVPDSKLMKEFFCSLAMAVIFWIPATVAVITIVSAIPLKSASAAITGAIGLLVALLFRFFIKQIAKDKAGRREAGHAD